MENPGFLTLQMIIMDTTSYGNVVIWDCVIEMAAFAFATMDILVEPANIVSDFFN